MNWMKCTIQCISIQCDIVNIGNFFPSNSACFFVSFAVLMWVLRNMSQRLSTTLFVDDLEPEVTKASAAMVCSNLGSDDGWLLTTANSYSRDHTLPETFYKKKIGGYFIIMPQNSCFTDHAYISIPPK